MVALIIGLILSLGSVVFSLQVLVFLKEVVVPEAVVVVQRMVDIRGRYRNLSLIHI